VPRLCEVYPGICLTTEEKKHGKTSVGVAGECQLAKSIQNRAYLHQHKSSNATDNADDLQITETNTKG